jgi:hypothetical protein
MRRVAIVLSVAGIMFFFLQRHALARQGLFHGNAEGAAVAEVSSTTMEEVVRAAKKVFMDDGFKVAAETEGELVFERPGRMGKDLSYGGVVSGEGVWERVRVYIEDNGEGSYTLSCEPAMVKDKGDDFFEDEQKVLKMFAGEYRRLLNGVAREVKHVTK